MPKPVDPKDLKVCPEVAEFALLMEMRLQENEEKGRWDYCSRSALVELLIQEVGELVGPLVRSSERVESTCTLKPIVARKAANVANFAMMIADNWGGLMRPE